MKKCVTTLFALAATAGIVSALPDSKVNVGTAGLISDDAIDSLNFGLEDKKGIVFTATNATNVEAGWGQYLSDALWLSVYDGYNFNGSSSEKESITHSYGTTDDVNVDYIDTARTLTVGSGSKNFYNTLAFGIALNKSIGFQPYWTASWNTYQTPSTFTAGSALGGTTTTTESSTESTQTGTNTNTEYTDIKNKTRNNTFGVKFNGIGTPKLLGDREFYVALNEISFNTSVTKRSGDYSTSTVVNGTTTSDISADGIYKTAYYTPSIDFELGLFLGQFGPAKTSFVLGNVFDMTFEGNESNTHHTSVTNNATTRTTVSTDFERSYGDYFAWHNEIAPRVDFDFDLNERLTLKTRAKFAVGFGHTTNDDDTTDVTTTTTAYNKETNTTTVTRRHVKSGVGNQNSDVFETTLAPEFDLGVVYQAVPEKFNINFGLAVETGTFTWTKTNKTNANENTVTTTTYTDELGNTTSTTAVTVANAGTGTAETSEYSFNNGTTSAYVYLGGTWFFSEDVKMDFYYSNSGTSFFSNTNGFGIDFSIRY
ncbi:MAG: hypothetical protein IKO57_03655 [Treponema sp.]|nr:hypothetical protein [Treponema sp.]